MGAFCFFESVSLLASWFSNHFGPLSTVKSTCYITIIVYCSDLNNVPLYCTEYNPEIAR